MSNLHLLLDEANKHTPKGFDPAINNTFPWKDELGLSTYREQMELPKAINFVDGTVAAPTTADDDIYVLTGSGVIDASWGSATFGDWVRFTNTIATEITPLTGYLCYDVTAASWMEYDGAVWAVFGGGGVVNTIFTGGTMAAPSTILMASNDLTFDGGQTTLKGAGATLGTTALLVENSSGTDLLEVKDDGTTTIGGDTTIGALPASTNTRLTVDTISAHGIAAVFKDATSNLVRILNNGGFDSGRGVLEVYKTGGVPIKFDSGGVSYFNTGKTLVINGTSAVANDGALAIHTDASNVACKIFDQNGDAAYRIISQNLKNKFEIYNFGGATIQHLFQSNGNDSYVNGTTTANFGIGIAAPTAKLHVVGSTLLDGNLGVFGATPIAQPTTGITAAAFVANSSGIVDDTATWGGYTGGQMVAALKSLGALA